MDTPMTYHITIAPYQTKIGTTRYRATFDKPASLLDTREGTGKSPREALRELLAEAEEVYCRWGPHPDWLVTGLFRHGWDDDYEPGQGGGK